MRVRKKPVAVDAVQFLGVMQSSEDTYPGFSDRPDWLVEVVSSGQISWRDDGHLVIRTLEDGPNGEAKHIADPLDWIVRGVKGELYAVKPEIFNETYEIL